MRRRIAPETLVTALVVGGAVAFVLSQLDPAKLLANTTPAGGDMGAHVWAPAYLRDHLLHHGRLSGWTPDWYAGFPALTFYFPLPSILIVLADVLLPYGVAFKLVSVLGLVALPVAAWAFGRLSGMRFPGPALLGLATVPYLFDRSWQILGGNVASTLAGEFSFSIGLALALVFLGVVAKGMDDGRHRAWAAVLLALCALCHVLTTLFAVVGAGLLWLQRADRRRTWWLVSAGAVAFALAAFWVVPVVFRSAYMNDMGWERSKDFLEKLLWPPAQLRIWPLAGVGAVISVLLARRTGTVLTALAAVSALAFRFLPQGRLWNERFLPFWYLCLYLLAAIAVTEVAVWLTGRFLAHQRRMLYGALEGEGEGEGEAGTEIEDELREEPLLQPSQSSEPGEGLTDWDDRALWPWPSLALPLLSLLVVLLVVGVPLRAFWFADRISHDRSFVSSWIDWNYSGYERKPAYREYKGVVDTMARVGRERGCGRAMWEYGDEILNSYGTPMALMLLPYWTHGCIGSMEGLYFESAASVPYHFIDQSELSKKPSRAMRNLPYGDVDLDKGIAHLRLMGVRYYLAFTPEIVEQAKARPDLELVDSFGQWSIFEVKNAPLVQPLAFQPVVLESAPKGGPEWVDVSVAAYQQPGPVMLASAGPKEWARLPIGHQRPTRASDGRRIFGTGIKLGEAPRTAVAPTQVREIKATDDSISFDVDRVGTPVLVKASYFPNWQASGAEGPWRVAPNLMVVIPTSTHVRLHYGFTPVEGLGWLLTLAGIAGAVLLARRPALAYLDAGGEVEGERAGTGGDGGPDGNGAGGAGDDLVEVRVAAARPVEAAPRRRTRERDPAAIP